MMNRQLFGGLVAALLVPQQFSPNIAHAHGPQLQITNDSGKVVTREIRLEGPYSDHLSAAISAYVIPVRVQDDIAYVRPNQTVDTITGLPNYLSGPGLAHGYNVVDNR